MQDIRVWAEFNTPCRPLRPPRFWRFHMSSHSQVRLLAATEPLLNALNDSRALFGKMIGSSVPDGWPEFPAAIGSTLEHLQTASEADRSWSMQFFVDHGDRTAPRLRWLRGCALGAHRRDRLRDRPGVSGSGFGRGRCPGAGRPRCRQRRGRPRPCSHAARPESVDGCARVTRLRAH